MNCCMENHEKTCKKLYRSRQNRIIAGVCGGLAEYFNVDPTIMRLGFVGFALAGGSALVIYALMWLIVPLKH